MQLKTLHERTQLASGMASRRVNPVVVLEQLPVSVLESLCQHGKQDVDLTDRHTLSKGSVPCDVIRPTTDSPSRLPQTLMRIDGLLLGPGSCRLVDVWVPEPNSEDEATVEPELLCDEHEEQSEPSGQVETSGVTEPHSSLISSTLPKVQQLLISKSSEYDEDTGQGSSGKDSRPTRCPVKGCKLFVVSVKKHLRKDHRYSKIASKHIMARKKIT